MPTIDYDLHPLALAFGIVCFLVTSGLFATFFYVALRGRSEASTSDAPDFVPPSAHDIDFSSPRHDAFNAPAYDRETGADIERELSEEAEMMPS
ncbi:hypothetical protein [Longibacter sp.]|jgi:hypothetical protein|uniref:hypothetical protein n=1 Tax=Longibacter sp. TaxID=2045415 RepID=UPI003EBBA38D